MITEINPEIGELVRKNQGYCPCAVIHDKDTRCPCKDFRDQESGVCHCGRYEKVVTPL